MLSGMLSTVKELQPGPFTIAWFLFWAWVTFLLAVR